MVVGVKTAAAGVSAVGLVTLLSGLAVQFRSPRSVSNDLMDVMGEGEGAVAGRVVSVPVKVYREAFKDTLQLGECPLVMENGSPKKCTDAFSGDQILLAKGGMSVAVTRVQTSEDVTQYIMGGFGASVGVLGLVSVGVKYNVGVTTETSKKTLNLMSTYEMDKGILTLHAPKPKSVIAGSGALFLSEIELGGSEMLLVTMEFESEKQKVEVEITITFKILFWTISAKIKFTFETFKSKASARIQFLSTWRQTRDDYFSSLEAAYPKVEEVEAMYMEGPGLLRDLSNDDEKTHNFYYFSSWTQSPYGASYNLALINHDLDFLGEQNYEMISVINRITRLSTSQTWTPEIRQQMTQLNSTLTAKTKQLTTGLDTYHTLSVSDRQKLRDIYGEDKAPLYYSRELSTIIQE